jgi:hypothetical protein
MYLVYKQQCSPVLPHPTLAPLVNTSPPKLHNVNMLPKIKPSAFNQSDLTSSLSSAARKQNLLAAVPPALRLLPLAAIAAGDLYERRHGRNPLEVLIGPGKRDQIEVSCPTSSVRTESPAPNFSEGPTNSCGTCLRRGLDGFRIASLVGNSALWQGPNFDCLRRSDEREIKGSMYCRSSLGQLDHAQILPRKRLSLYRSQLLRCSPWAI